jgi:hypothetical protein
MSQKLDFLYAKKTTSGPDKLREQLQVLEDELPLLGKKNREAVTAYLLTMDAAARILKQLQTGVDHNGDVISESLRFATVQQQLLRKAGKLYGILGREAGLRTLRPADATPDTRPWWFIDLEIARLNARRQKQIIIIGGAVLSLLIGLWVVFNTVLKPDPNVVMKAERYQTALDDVMQSQDYAAALADVEQILAVFPQQGDVLTLKGVLLEQRAVPLKRMPLLIWPNRL